MALTIGIGLMTLFAVVLSTATQFAAHEANRHFAADYLLSVNRGGIPEPVVDQPAGEFADRCRRSGYGKAPCRWTVTRCSCWQPSRLPTAPCSCRCVHSGSLSAVETGTGGIALSALEASGLHVTVGGTVSVNGNQFVVDATFSNGVLDETAVISWADFAQVLGPGEDTEVAVKARPGVRPRPLHRRWTRRSRIIR